MPTAPRMRLASRLLSGVIALALFAVRASAQGPEPAALCREFSWRSLGPTNLGGRVDDVEGVPSNPEIVSVAESPVMPGVLWVGTNDGNPQVSRDGGATWANVGEQIADVPAPYYVESIAASHDDPGTAYGAFDGHHAGDYRPYLFKTTDYGRSWTRLSSGLPDRGHIRRETGDQ